MVKLNERVILRVKNNLVYTGKFKGKMKVDRQNGILVELDPNSCLSLWCPEKSIASIAKLMIQKKETSKK